MSVWAQVWGWMVVEWMLGMREFVLVAEAVW